MKLHITLEDLMELSESQKRSLRSLWMPQKYDLAVAFVCMNVETEEIDKIEFAVGDVLLREIRREKRFEVRQYAALYDAYDVTFRSLRQLDEVEEGEDGEAEEATEEDNFDYTYLRQEDFFNMEYCLPLLNIGQMLRILEELEYKKSEYRISFEPESKKYLLARPGLEYMDGTGVEGKELCDVLWTKLKEYLK